MNAINIISAQRSKLSKMCSPLLTLFSALSMSLLIASTATAQAPKAGDFQRTTIASGLDLTSSFEISKDGRIFIISKLGKFYGWSLSGPANTSQATTIPQVLAGLNDENGLISIALDPNFTTNSYVYLQFSVSGAKTRVARFTVKTDNSLDLASEKTLLEWPVREANGHFGGTLKFDKNGDLLITVGDNTAAGGYFTPGAQETSGNTNDLRGKVLRITPTAAGGYTIPAGNLFPADTTHRGEIFAMGFRNPYRLNIDPLTNYYYLGDIGPDASANGAEGPYGMDELNEIKEAGNFGWPYIIGYNQPYAGYNPNNITNNDTKNTGAKNLPASKPALWTIMHRATMSGPVYRFNDANKNEFKLPAYYDGRLIYWDFNSGKFFTINPKDTNSPPVPEDLPLNTNGLDGPIDAQLDPTTQQLYVLQWGNGCCDKQPFGKGVLYRFDYIGDRDNGTNLASSATIVSVSSTAGGNNAEYMFDGIDGSGPTKTRWESAPSDPQSFVMDLHTLTDIASIVIKWEPAYSSKYTIEGSTSATGPWDVLVDEKAGTGGNELKMINSTKKYQFIRFTGLARGSAYGHSIYEFEVYAGKASTEEPLTEFAYLNMPKTLDVAFTGVPKLLSQTGAFTSVANANFVTSTNMIPFAPISQLWSDRAAKSRWISIPKSKKINWSAKDNWTYPQGTVAVKHFALPIDTRNPTLVKPLETRLIVTKADGKVYGVTYKWRADGSDADLITTGTTQNFTVTKDDGSTTTQTWTYPSPTDCLSCHNADSSQILGLSTRQLNSNYTYAGGATENQLVHLNNLGLFTPALSNAQVGTYDKLATLADTSATLEKRIKSYLDANCAHCHGTNNGGSQWDARFNTPVAQMKILNSLTTGIRKYDEDYGIANAKVIASGLPSQSILYIRDKSVGTNDRMPPLGRAMEHTEYIDLLSQWITSLNSTVKIPAAPAKLTPATATASTSNGGNNALAAIDGNTTTTRWESVHGEGTQYLQLDMGKSTYFTKVVLTWEPAYAKEYTIDVSENGDDWVNAYSTSTGRGGVETLVLDGQKGRYIRMRGTVRASTFGYSLYEFEAYGLAADTNPTLISFVTPAANAVIDQTTAVKLKVGITDTNWLNSAGYNYYLDNNAAVRATSADVDLGQLPTGAHTLRISLADANGTDVGVPKVRKFRVSCGNSCPKVLVFSKTAGFRHGSIAAGIAMVNQIATENGFAVTASEDASLFTTTNLANYTTIVFMNTTGDIFDANQKAAFKAYIEGGGGFVGTHSAADTEHNWAWYTGTLLGGGEFIHHGDGIPRAKVKIEKTTNPLVNHIGAEWFLSDEWYFWKNDPRGVGNVEVLGTLDRTSYTSNYPVADHPVIYTNLIGKGRTFYTAVGHVDENFADPKMMEMIRKAIEWTSGQTLVVSSSSSSVASSKASSSAASSVVVVSSVSSAASSSKSSASSVSSVSVSSKSSSVVSSAVASSIVSSSSKSSLAGGSVASTSSVASSVAAASSKSSVTATSSSSGTVIVIPGSSAISVSSAASSSRAATVSSVASSVASSISSTVSSTATSTKSGGGGGSIQWIDLLLLSFFSAGMFTLRNRKVIGRKHS